MPRAYARISPLRQTSPIQTNSGTIPTKFVSLDFFGAIVRFRVSQPRSRFLFFSTPENRAILSSFVCSSLLYVTAQAYSQPDAAGLM